jgi:hypothetical protein
VTGMEIATACPNGGSYSSIEIVLGYRHDLALVVSADGAPHKESERPLYKRPVRAEAAHRRHTPPEQRFHRQLRQRVAFVAYHRSWKHRIKLLAPVSFGFGTFVLSLFLLTSFSAAARNFQSFDQPRRVQSSRPEQTFGRHKRAPRSVQVNIPLPPPRPRDLAGRKEPPRDAAPKDALAPALPPGDDPETCAAVLATGLCGIEHPLMLNAIILADKRHIQFEPPWECAAVSPAPSRNGLPRMWHRSWPRQARHSLHSVPIQRTGQKTGPAAGQACSCFVVRRDGSQEAKGSLGPPLLALIIAEPKGMPQGLRHEAGSQIAIPPRHRNVARAPADCQPVRRDYHSGGAMCLSGCRLGSRRPCRSRRASW